MWRARDRADRVFAVKILRPDLASDPAVVTRFVRERSMIIGLSSPYLVPVHDFVVEGDTLAIVMDLVDGPDLRAELRQRGTLPPAEALRVTSAVLRGLAVVHAKGIVHRDIKPSNILMDEAGGGKTPKITDFGVGWLFDDTHMTSTSSVIGTPEYMAPEYALGGEVSPAVDVYAAGVMLYELICGVTPFVGGNPMAVLHRHINNAPTKPDSMPDAAWELIEQILVKDPAERPGAALAATASAQLADQLADLPAGPVLTQPPASTPLTSAASGSSATLVRELQAEDSGLTRISARQRGAAGAASTPDGLDETQLSRRGEALNATVLTVSRS